MSGNYALSLDAFAYSYSRTAGTTPAMSNGGLPSSDASTEVLSIQTRSQSDYTVTVSEEAKDLSDHSAKNDSDIPTSLGDTSADDPFQPSDDPAITSVEDSDSSADDAVEESDMNQLTESEQEEVDDLEARDAEVRTHEQAHQTAGGQYAGSPSYSYTQGPDGKRYITDGEVSIDVSKVSGDPQATISKMEQVIRAAMAPAEPSSADHSVAREARAAIAEARSELNIDSEETESRAPTDQSYSTLAAENASNRKSIEAYQSTLTDTPSSISISA